MQSCHPAQTTVPTERHLLSTTNPSKPSVLLAQASSRQPLCALRLENSRLQSFSSGGAALTVRSGPRWAGVRAHRLPIRRAPTAAILFLVALFKPAHSQLAVPRYITCLSIFMMLPRVEKSSVESHRGTWIAQEFDKILRRHIYRRSRPLTNPQSGREGTQQSLLGPG